MGKTQVVVGFNEDRNSVTPGKKSKPVTGF